MVLFGPPDERLRARMDYAGERIQTAFHDDTHEVRPHFLMNCMDSQ